MSKDLRDAFFDEVVEFAKNDPRAVVLANDQAAFVLETLKKDFPEKYHNIGIAEQNIINVSAGLALGGMRPVAYGITNFMSMRCFEQIAVNLGCMNLPVMIVASGGGLTYASDGPTHHPTQDISILRTVPNMTIFNPSDAVTTAYSARAGLALNSPSYVRLEKGVVPDLHEEGKDLSMGFGFVREGRGALIVSTGHLTQRAVEVSDALKQDGVQTVVLDVFRLKPVDEDALSAIFGKFQNIFVIEEQNPFGGLGSLAAELKAKRDLNPKVRTFSLPDAPCYQYGSRDWLHGQFGLDAETLAAKIKGAL